MFVLFVQPLHPVVLHCTIKQYNNNNNNNNKHLCELVSSSLMITGDFNIHVDFSADVLADKLSDILHC